MQNVVKEGGIIDGVSTVLDYTVNKIKKLGKIDTTTANIILKGKDVILNTVEGNIEKTFKNQKLNKNQIEQYIENWNKFYKQKDFNNMEKEIKKIEKEMKELVPLEEIIIKAKEIENLHQTIKNNEGKFEISNEEIELSKKLATI